MSHHTDAERAEFEMMRAAYEKAFGPPPVGAAWSGVGYAIKTHEASEARAYAERFKGFIAGWVSRRAPAEPPVFYVRWRGSDGLYEGPTHHSGLTADQITSEGWTPLFAAEPQPPEAAHGPVSNAT